MEMTPSKPVTEGQIGKLNGKLRERILKKKDEIPSDVLQDLLRDDTLIDEFCDAIHKRVKLRSKFFTRVVKVNRNRSAKEALVATGKELISTLRRQDVNYDVVSEMPNGKDEEVRLFLYQMERWEYNNLDLIDDNEIKKSFDRRGLKPADPFAVCALNEEDYNLSSRISNLTFWKDSRGKACVVHFCSMYPKGVFVNFFDHSWFESWFLVGVLKNA